MARSARTHLSIGTLVAAFALGMIGAGCEDTDWSWDPYWWRKPRRVVRPRRPVESPPAAPIAESNDGGVSSQPTRPAEPIRVAGDPEPAMATPTRRSPFHQLYLLSGTAERPTGRGDFELVLRRVSAGACARVLETLYVPSGRLGSDDESYLLFEEEAEFEAAKLMAPKLDVPPLATAPSAVGPEESYRTGIGLFYAVLSEGPLTEPARIQACESRLVLAARAAQFDRLRRWAAAVLAGRLASDYRYDYAAARGYLRQAERLGEAGSIEQMTARWWIADAHLQDGADSDARRIYRSILKDFPRWRGAQIPRRAQAWLDRHR